MLKLQHHDIRQFLRFAIVGVLQNGTNLSVFALGVTVGIPYLLAAVIAAVMALALSFILNQRWTFTGTDDRTSERAVRFLAIWVGFIALALPALALLVDVAHLPRVLSQAMIICLGAPLSYFVQRHWAFRPTPESPARPASATAPVSSPPRPVDRTPSARRTP